MFQYLFGKARATSPPLNTTGRPLLAASCRGFISENPKCRNWDHEVVSILGFGPLGLFEQAIMPQAPLFPCR